MLTPIEWTDGALEDLERMRDFLEPKNPDAARRAALTLIKATELLADNPQIGTPVMDMLDDGNYRDMTIPFGSYGYRLRYRYEQDIVYILYIKHDKEEAYWNLPRA